MSIYRRHWLIAFLVLAIPASGFAQDSTLLNNAKQKQKKTSSESVNPKNNKNKAPKRLRPEVESRIDAFVQKNHPELKKVLEYLKEKRGTDYYRAMMQIKKTSDRLESYKKRDPERYRIDLKLWQAQSRITLLAAEIAVNNKEKLKNKLRKAIRDENALKIRRIELERSRIVARLKRLNEQESKLERIQPNAIEQTLKSHINRFKPKRKKQNKKNDRRKNDQQ